MAATQATRVQPGMVTHKREKKKKGRINIQFEVPVDRESSEAPDHVLMNV